jgi:Tfp pilus assembly protein PilV
MPFVTRRGDSLIELLVALVLLEIVGTLALGAVLSVERANRRAALGAAQDRVRWESYRAAEVSPGCVGAATPTAVPFALPATLERPAMSTLLRCGR